MKPREHAAATAEIPASKDDAATGLPWPHTWPGVYWLVMASFVLWVGLLVALTVFFS